MHYVLRLNEPAPAHCAVKYRTLEPQVFLLLHSARPTYKKTLDCCALNV
jgi:hypothetical protein